MGERRLTQKEYAGCCGSLEPTVVFEFLRFSNVAEVVVAGGKG
jgi:hypothetical protein